jgi:hypothetical protein
MLHFRSTDVKVKDGTLSALINISEFHPPTFIDSILFSSPSSIASFAITINNNERESSSSC